MATSPTLAPRKKQRILPLPRVVHEDCIEGMKRIKSNTIRLILADPPYGIHVQGAGWDSSKGYQEFATAWLEQAARVLQPGGTLLYFASPCTIWSSRMNVLLEDRFGLTHVQTLSWVYTQGSRHSNPLNYLPT